MPTSRTTKGDSTQSEIIHAAAQLFIQQGYHGTSMRQIAKAAGLALGSAYNHFSSKEAIFQAAFITYHPYVKIIPTLLTMTDLPTEQFVNKTFQLLSHALEENPLFINLLFIEIIEFNGEHIIEIFKNMVPIVEKIAIKFVNTHTDLRPIPPLIIMRSLMGMFLAYYTTKMLFAPFGPPQFSENASSIFPYIYLHGILLPDTDAGSKTSVE
jgi:AcrR family transcriptional regulator